MTDTHDTRPQYSMLIEFDPREGGCYTVSFPEWEAANYIASIQGATYEEAAANGRDLLEFLIQSAKEEGESLPAPRLFADANANAPAGA